MQQLTSSIDRNILPLIVATALFMENLDATALSTALPAIAADFGTSPIHLKLAVTTYLLALAIFIPASGWVADRFGARNVFRLAILVFAAGSIGCALSQGLGSLVAARVLQGIGGAMMVPVGRLVILRTIPKHQLVDALAWLTVPALLGPILGPPVGGFITTYFDWRWIFWINIPVAILGFFLVSIYIPNIRAEQPERFDAVGFLLVGPGLSMFLTGATIAGLGVLDGTWVALLIVSGALLLGAYIVYALGAAAPIIDLRLLAVPTFRASVLGGLLFRIGIGSMPFLLPLLLQIGFGLTPFQSGLTTFATGIGALMMKPVASRILNAYGFRRVLIVNALISGLFTFAPALYSAATPLLLITLVLFLGGLSRSLQFTSINVLAYADIPPEKLSRATSFTAALQELSGSIGVSIAALGLEIAQGFYGGALIDAVHFPPVFFAIALLSVGSMWFFTRLPADAGSSLLAPAKPETLKQEPVAAEHPPPPSHV